jgi:hypothetical protein
MLDYKTGMLREARAFPRAASSNAHLANWMGQAKRGVVPCLIRRA